MVKHSKPNATLIVRLSAIGDVVMASPVASAIKRKTPESFVAWVVQPECASLLENNPNIDKVIIWDKKKWRTLWKEKKLISLWREIRSLQSELRSYEFQTALDLQGLLKSGFISWLSGAPCRISLGATEGSNWLMTKTISRELGDMSQIGSEYRYLVNQLGMSDTPWQMHVSTPREEKQERLKELQSLIGNDEYVAICPFTTRPQKHWFDSNWQQLMLRIRGRYKMKSVVLGGPADKEHAHKLSIASGGVNLAGKTNLQEAAEIIKNASLVIGVDTGLTHIGHVFKTPTIALFGSTCPYSYVDLDTSKVLYLDLPCSPCKRSPTCDGRFDCMRQITPDMVLTEIRTLMKYQSEHA